MSVERPRRSWATAGAAALLIGSGVLTRVACAPSSPPVARAPGKSAVDTRTGDAVDGSSNDAASTIAADGSANEPDQVEAEPRAGALSVAPFNASAMTSPPPASADTEPYRAAAPNGALQHTTRQELSLLATIERDLKREAPPEVHALLSQYRRGADRSTLLAHVHRNLGTDLPLRVTVLRWIDEVRPDRNQPSHARPPAPGHGTRAGWVRPLERRRAP
jgi:hypothetical protein